MKNIIEIYDKHVSEGKENLKKLIEKET